jgi:hypothetical protein
VAGENAASIYVFRKQGERKGFVTVMATGDKLETDLIAEKILMWSKKSRRLTTGGYLALCQCRRYCFHTISDA